MNNAENRYSIKPDKAKRITKKFLSYLWRNALSRSLNKNYLTETRPSFSSLAQLSLKYFFKRPIEFLTRLQVFFKVYQADLKKIQCELYGDLGKTELMDDNANKAEEYFNLALTLNTQINRGVNKSVAYQGLGDVALLKEDYEKAQKWYKEGLAVGEEYQDWGRIAEAYRGLRIIALTQNDFALAKKYEDETRRRWRALGLREFYIEERLNTKVSYF